MNNFNFWTPTRYSFGKGVEELVGKQASEIGAKKILLVYGGKSAKKSGLLDRVKASLEAENIGITELGGINPNPTDDRVYEGIELVRKNGIDSIIAVGGGSAIDTAKAVAAGALYDGDFWDFFSGKASIEAALPIGVVLTIPAAGSEGSGNAVITKIEGMHKISIRTEYQLRPKFALLNPELTFTLPPYQTASGIADMMAHIMERYFSNTEGVEITDCVSEGILRAIIEEAPKVIADPYNYDARANIMWSGTLAHNGICGCGRVEDWTSHAMEHEISALYGVTHGAGLAVVFPAWMTFMAEHNPAKIAQFGRRVFGIRSNDDKTAALEGIAALRAFFASIGLPVNLGGLGIENPDFDTLVRKLHENKGAEIGGYFRLKAAQTAEIYRLML